jgi:D-aminoacyl-tRNA deacylase
LVLWDLSTHECRDLFLTWHLRRCNWLRREPSPILRRMIGLLQRVTQASVVVKGRRIGVIECGLLVLVGVQRGDTESQADRLLERLLTYRVFADDAGRMNRCLQDVNGGLLLVPQFTLAADTSKGTRPGFSPAADPTEGRRLFEYVTQKARDRHRVVQTGEFGADMQVSLINDGPVTFWLEVTPHTAE